MRIATQASVSVSLGKVERPPANDATAHIPIILTNPVQGFLASYIAENRQHCTAVVQPKSCDGRSLAICGAGPSLRGARTETFSATQDIWAVNSALPYLIAADVPVTAAIGIDQTPGLLREWESPPDVTYYVASSVDPELVRYLIGHGRDVVFFHNYVGVGETQDDEFAMYRKWPSTFLVMDGFSVSSRAVRLAQFMGYERVDLHGVDCCFGVDDMAHANGEHATAAYHNPAISVGVTNGRIYRTRPDMLMDAVHLVRLVRQSMGSVRLIGDTLPVQLLGKTDDYLDLVCRRVPPAEYAELSRAPQPQPSPLDLSSEAVA